MFATVAMLVGLAITGLTCGPAATVTISVECPTTNASGTPLADLQHIEVWAQYEDAPGSGNFTETRRVGATEVPAEAADGANADGTPYQVLFDVGVTDWADSVTHRFVARAGDMTQPTNWSGFTEAAVDENGNLFEVDKDSVPPAVPGKVEASITF